MWRVSLMDAKTAASPNGTDDSAGANQFFEFSGAISQAPAAASDPGQ
jgi:hypothetical protein